jgi:transposase
MSGLYAGLDVSQETTKICVVDAKGAVQLETETATSPDAIAGTLKPYRRQLRCVGQESGNMTPWLEQALIKARFPMVALDPARAHATLNRRLNKTDTNDAHGLALLLASGLYSRAYTKRSEAVRIRALLVLRESIVRKGVDLASMIRMTEQRLVSDRQKQPRRASSNDGQQALGAALAIVKARTATLQDDRNRLDRIVTKLAKENDICQRLMTIPGVGPITALTFIAAVDDPKRFSSSRDVGAYFGLTPRTFQSGNSSRSGGISHRGDHSVRKALYAAAFSLVFRFKADCALGRWGRRIARIKGTRLACTAVARKLAVLMHHLWITGEEFDPER